MKSKFVFVVLLLFCSLVNYAQTRDSYVHCADSLNTGNYFTILDHPYLNNNPNACIIIQKLRIENNDTIISNPYNVALYYSEFDGWWVILNTNEEDMQINTCYIITVTEIPDDYYTLHKAESITIISGFPNVSAIDSPVMNDNESARSMVTKVDDDAAREIAVINDNPTELYYNWETPGKWYISTPPGQDMPIGAAFNILSNPEGFTIYEHESTFENTDSEVNGIDDYAYWTVLDHELLNNNPDAILFVSHRREPATTFIYKSYSVYYNSDTGKWQLHIELEDYISDFSFPVGNLFDIFIFDSTIGVDDITLNKDVKIFPNPTNTMFNIKTNGNISEVFLYNILGQEIEKISGINDNTSKIDISNYQKGIYFVKVKTENSFETVKLIKN